MPNARKHHSVYMVELDKAVLKNRRFVAKNPNHDPKKVCLYVGMTGLDPETRFANHKAGYRANRYVQKFGMRLRRQLFEQLNPMTYKEAQVMEVALAQQLRRKGYALWQA